MTIDTNEIDCGGRGCGADETKACLRCCRILIANNRANHGDACDYEQERLHRTAASAIDELHKAKEQLAAMTAARDSAVSEVERMRPVMQRVRDDLDGAIAAHDITDPRHPSKGGQHTNGRCCAFGNLNPGALRNIRELRDAIDAALVGAP